MLSFISRIDKNISKPIIHADNLIFSILLYPFAAFFHPQLIFLAYASIYYFSNYDQPITILYIVGTGLCLLTTTILKRILKRSRP